MREVEKKICPECSIEFNCGGTCWCNKYPPIIPVTPNRVCYCETCLHKVMVKSINEIMQDLNPEMEAKIKALGPVTNPMLDIDYYSDSEGNEIHTEWYILRSSSVS